MLAEHPTTRYPGAWDASRPSNGDRSTGLVDRLRDLGGRAGAAAGRVGIARGRFRPPRRQPVRPARLQRRGVSRVVPGAGRTEPEPLRPRPGPGLRRAHPQGPGPSGGRASIPTEASSCSSRPARSRTRGASGSRSARGSIGSSAPGSPPGPGATRRGRRSSGSRSGPEQLSLGRPGDSARLSVVARFADGTEARCDPVLRPPRQRRRRRRGRPGRRGPRPAAGRHGGRRLVQRPARRGAGARCPRAASSPSPTSRSPTVIDREVFAKLRSLGIAPSGPVVRRRVPPPRHARRHRHAADAARRSGAFLADRVAGQAMREDRRAARPPDARRALGHAVPRHHRLRRRSRWRAPTT